MEYVVVLLFLLWTLLGVTFLWKGSKFFILGLMSKYWPVTKGRILRSTVKEGALASGRGVIWASVRYEYRVSDRIYQGRRIGFGKYGTAWNNTTDRSVAESLGDTFRTGTIVNVYYMPRLPYFSVLQPGFRWASLFLIFLGILWTWYPGSFLIWMFSA